MSLVGPRPEQPNIVEELKRQIPFTMKGIWSSLAHWLGAN